jgi:hypothetical protein
MPEKKYVVWNTQNRLGEFEFNAATQDHIFTSLPQAQKWVRQALLDDLEDDYYQNDWVIYEITLTEKA